MWQISTEEGALALVVTWVAIALYTGGEDADSSGVGHKLTDVFGNCLLLCLLFFYFLCRMMIASPCMSEVASPRYELKSP